MTRALDYRPGGPAIVLAHRGGSAELENSPSAFVRAAALGVRHIETDARASADGVALLIHDATLERTTNGTGPVSSHRWAELAELSMRNGDPLPRLSQMLAQHPQLLWNIDVKCDDAVLPVLDAIGAERAWDRVAVASFSSARLRRMRALAGARLTTATTPVEVARLRLGLPSGPGRPAAAQIPVRFSGLTVLTERLLRRAHEAGIAVHVWTVNDPAQMVELLTMGVDGLVTDHPDVALDLIG